MHYIDVNLVCNKLLQYGISPHISLITVTFYQTAMQDVVIT